MAVVTALLSGAEDCAYALLEELLAQALVHQKSLALSVLVNRSADLTEATGCRRCMRGHCGAARYTDVQVFMYVLLKALPA